MKLFSQTIYLDGVVVSNEALSQEPGLKPYLDQTTDYLQELGSSPEHPDLSFVRGLSSETEIAAMEARVVDLAKHFTHLVIFGIGGSSIGGQALCSILKYKKLHSKPHLKVKFIDNLGHHQLEDLFEELDLSQTHFLVISKSGNTAETLAQCLVSLDTVRSSLGHSNIRNNFTVIVQPGESQLRNLAQSEGFDIIDHIGELGGRFSALSAIGLTPAIARGFDAKIAVEAARNLYISSTNPETPTHNNMPLLGAAVQAQLVDKGINQSIFMPYESRLIDFTRWYQQLWAESLGKNGKGTTPVGALGPLDQHSQLQLFLDGPRDKFFTFLIGSAEGVGFRLNKSDCEKFGVNYLAGNTIGDLVNAEAIETINALVDRGLPVRVLKYRALDEDFIGELMAHFFMETLFMAKMIEVDPFGQPAIERSKILTKEYLANSSRGLK